MERYWKRVEPTRDDLTSFPACRQYPADLLPKQVLVRHADDHIDRQKHTGTVGGGIVRVDGGRDTGDKTD